MNLITEVEKAFELYGRCDDAEALEIQVELLKDGLIKLFVILLEKKVIDVDMVAYLLRQGFRINTDIRI